MSPALRNHRKRSKQSKNNILEGVTVSQSRILSNIVRKLGLVLPSRDMFQPWAVFNSLRLRRLRHIVARNVRLVSSS